jgi:periplasmic protein TonB
VQVTLNADGTVRDAIITRPSGHRVLDEAALRIVRLAAPYAPFPKEIREDVDIMHITRTWEFTSGNRLNTQ